MWVTSTEKVIGVVGGLLWARNWDISSQREINNQLDLVVHLLPAAANG
jgi:hypothetical protein